ncbi:MAG: hypothetical protein ABR551_13625 [Gemmatimonadales bacterium]
MYHTCLHCQRPFGANEAIEHLPIGRRVAFDGHRGRLWVVCGKCGRWNLVPFESRWEALEECEKAFRTATRRASTDQIALARLGEGLDLVRIGEPLRPEFAAWRYGEVLQARRRRYTAYALAGTATIGVLMVGGMVAGAGTGGLLGNAHLAWEAVRKRWVNTMKVRAPDGAVHRVNEIQVLQSELLSPDEGIPRLSVRLNKREELLLTGQAARNALPGVLAIVNAQGAGASDLENAVSILGTSGGVEGYLAGAARLIPKWKRDGRRQLSYLLEYDRLALEMALHEESERRALDGELHLLLDAWREAEELAGIADRLALPVEVEAKLESLKREGEIET